MKQGEKLAFGSQLTEENMAFLKQLGVNYLLVRTTEDTAPTARTPVVSRLWQSDYYRTEDLIDLKQWVASCGLELGGLLNISFQRWGQIILGRPGRDQQIEHWCRSISNMGKAGIPMLHYRWTVDVGAPLANWRTTADTVGRGGAKLVSFDNELARKVPVSDFGQVTEPAMWDNLTYFLKAVIPVAEESGVNIVMHPADPQVPSIAGLARIIRSVEAYRRLFEIVPSSYSRMVFCLGCFSQMLDDEGVDAAISYFGTRDKIGYVDFRNTRGSLEQFDEVYPDEGKLDMFRAIKRLDEAGYKGLIVTDHSPHGTADTEYGHVAHAFQIGYLKGLLQAASALD